MLSFVDGAESSKINLPDFIICGTQKGGTTALRMYLRQHPCIYMPKREMHFFSWYFNKGVGWYAKHFRYNSSHYVCGEKSPSYMFHAQEVAERMKEILPSPKLIFMLRDPVKRAYSEYWMMVLNGKEKLSFDEAIWKKDRDYLIRGHYAKQIKEFLKYFDRENMMVIISEDFRKNREKRMWDVFDFLGIEQIRLKMPNIHVGGIPRSKFLLKLAGISTRLSMMAWDSPLFRNFFCDVRSAIKRINRVEGQKPKMSEETRKKLYEYFKPQNEDLISLLNGLHFQNLAEIVKKEWNGKSEVG